MVLGQITTERMLLSRSQHLEVDVATRLLGLSDYKRCVFIEHAWVYCDALSVIADHTGPAGVKQRFARSLECVDERVDGARVITVGGVNDTVGCTGFADQQVAIVETADHRFDAQGFHLNGFSFVANQSANGVASAYQPQGDGAAYITVCACQKYAHVYLIGLMTESVSTRWRSVTANLSAKGGEQGGDKSSEK